LPTWRTETKVCVTCGRQYEARIWTRNGKDGPYETECRECRDKRLNEETRQAALKELEQAKENQRARWYQECGIPALFVDKTFENFNRELQPKAYDIIKGYDGEKSILLLSPDLYGVGKTHLVCALVNHTLKTREPASFSPNSYTVWRRPLPVFFITEPKLLARIRATFNRAEGQGGETDEDIYRRLLSYDLLIIDDVGKVRPRDYSFLQSVYFRMIDDRYTNEAPIILTTNLSLSELEAHIGGACADRLREMCRANIVKMAGESYRKQKPGS